VDERSDVAARERDVLDARANDVALVHLIIIINDRLNIIKIVESSVMHDLEEKKRMGMIIIITIIIKSMIIVKSLVIQSNRK